MRFILKLLTALLVCALGGCRSAEQLFVAAYEKDPSLFRQDTVIKKVPVPPVVTSFNCDSVITRGGVTLHIPRNYVIAGEKVADTVKVTLTAADSAGIVRELDAQIDCPPQEIRYVPEPYPVHIEPTLKDFVKAVPWWVWVMVGLGMVFGLVKIIYGG